MINYTLLSANFRAETRHSWATGTMALAGSAWSVRILLWCSYQRTVSVSQSSFYFCLIVGHMDNCRTIVGAYALMHYHLSASCLYKSMLSFRYTLATKRYLSISLFSNGPFLCQVLYFLSKWNNSVSNFYNRMRILPNDTKFNIVTCN